MDITIGVQNLPRELVIESEQTADEVTAAVSAALADKTVLQLVDTRGRRVVVPAAAIGYVEIGTETKGRVGFGAL